MMRSESAPALGEDEKQLLAEMTPRSGFKALPNNKWLGWWTNAFEDREKELFETQAIEEFVKYFDRELKSLPLYFWHIPFDLGKAEWLGVAGRIGVAAGTLNEDGAKFARFFEERPDIKMGMSHGFMWLASQYKDRAYQWFRTKELTLLPAFAAANEGTLWEGNMLTDEKKAMLVEIVGLKDADAILDQAREATKDMEAKGIRFKEGENAEVVVPATEAAPAAEADEAGETPATEEAGAEEPTETDEFKNMRLRLTIPPELTKEIAAGVVRELLESAAVKSIAAAFEAQTKVLEALAKDDTEKVKELVRELPTIEAYRASKDAVPHDKPTPPIAGTKSVFNQTLGESIAACNK